MKKLVLVAAISFSLSSYGQMESSLAKHGKLDFAVPEHPAFSILGNNSDNILRPGNSQEIFSLIYSNFLSGATPIIPKDFSIEFSPAQLIGINKITFEDYKKNGNRILYDSKLSLGGKTSDDGSELNSFAAGLRLTWVDKSSLAANQAFIDEACKGLISDARNENIFITDLIANGSLYKGEPFSEDDIAADDRLRDHVDSLYRNYIVNFTDASFFSIKSLREKYKNENWNKFKFETALAFKFNSPDSLVSNSYYSKFELYNTVGLPLGHAGQWLLGLNYSNFRNDSIQQIQVDSITTIFDTVNHKVSLATLASRIYIGTNRLKAYIEGSGKLGNDDRINIGLTIGAEVNITDGLWAMVNFGNNWSKSTDSNAPNKDWTDHWYWRFDFRFKIPEKMRL